MHLEYSSTSIRLLRLELDSRVEDVPRYLFIYCLLTNENH